jgi:transcriptional regulator with XRE-family HTH domain
MNFQEKLQFLRRKKGYSQEELSEKLGISRQAVAKWESGQTFPEVDNLLMLSDLFKITVDRLIKPDSDDCSLSLNEGDRIISEDMIRFLCEAKKSTYAAKGAETAPCRTGSHDYYYEQGDYKYLDTYFGGEKFIGEEAVWFQGAPVWSMNYCGRVIGEGFSGDFLKEALLLVPTEFPYRGPFVYHNGDYSYHCIVSGDVDWYQGYEEIFLQNDKIYECNFHGGSIK